MVRVTEELVRKRAEHNEGLISSLEELTLHQEGIEKIEYLDKWCRDLKILYLQNNIIPKIENVSRLKKLQYLNLTLNNIEEIENLEGCESLEKLDLTINFIWKLTSVEKLTANYNLSQLFLSGNPCAEYEGYRYFVIGALPQLTALDGLEITRTERYEAKKDREENREVILKHQEQYLKKRVLKKVSVDENHNVQTTEIDVDSGDYWTTPTEYTPESRIQAQKHLERLKENKKENTTREKPKLERSLFNKEGNPLNINEAKLDFKLTEDEKTNCFVLELKLFRYLDTSEVCLDVQPTYVRLLVKGKIFQLVLPEEIHPDKSSAERSRASGKLVITLPQVHRNEMLSKRHESFLSSADALREKQKINSKKSDPRLEEDHKYPDDMPKLI